MMQKIAIATLFTLNLLPRLGAAEVSHELAEKDRAKTSVCTDGKNHYLAIAPEETVTKRLFYGDGKRLFLVGSDTGGMMSGDWFFEPRRFAKGNNADFRGLDLRVYSHVDFAPEKGKCSVVCGDKATELKILEADKAQALLKAATFNPSSRQWQPYGLARDDRGTYYYVDRGFSEKDKGRFRLFVGAKGALKLQKMTNVVSDSEGDVFSTKTGSLRMIIGKSQSSWIENDKPKPLTLVPVMQNLNMIYTDLGIYTGERLGTPCDDF